MFEASPTGGFKLVRCTRALGVEHLLATAVQLANEHSTLAPTTRGEIRVSLNGTVLASWSPLTPERAPLSLVDPQLGSSRQSW